MKRLLQSDNIGDTKLAGMLSPAVWLADSAVPDGGGNFLQNLWDSMIECGILKINSIILKEGNMYVCHYPK